jgi:hypothetical protein
MNNAKRTQAPRKPFHPVLLTVVWGLVGGIIVPFLVVLVAPEGTCDSQYLPRIPVSGWPVLFFHLYRWVGVIVGTVLLIRAFKALPKWLARVNGIVVLGIIIWIYLMSVFLTSFYMMRPQTADQLIVDERQYVLAFCMDLQSAGGDAGIYLCENERHRSCHLLANGPVGMLQTPSLRYEDGNVIVDDMLFDPLVYPINGE